ncbi:hypothetical protein GFL39_11615 [Rhizobium leguminosarum bv. viciae]|uniref:hypothetical protein n=1 Tax=Rhizobium leguminosarum TaxID=384 RepID=UPI001440FBCE|nr:hypothetical protein [Rhizobium leguminosarum]NKL05594.1 hypothetical protein [Rhizobium leguminosarum bv. viciae]
MEVKDAKALRFVTSLIDPEVPLNTSVLHTDLHELDSGEIFMLCAFIAAVLDEVQQPSGRDLSFSIGAVSPDNLASAGQAVLNWPEGLTALETRLSQVGIFENAKPCLNPFIQNLTRSKHFRVTTIATVRAALATPLLGSLMAKEDELRAPEIHSRSFLLKLHKYALSSAEVRAMSDSLGIPRGVLFECFLSGSVHCPDKRLTAAANIRAKAGFDYLNFVKPNGRAGNVCLRVQSVVTTLYLGPANPWPFILEGIRDGALPITRAQLLSPNLVDTLQVQDFAPWIDFCGRLPDEPNAPEYPIIREEIAFHLDAPSNSRYGAGTIATLTQLSAFRRKFASAREVRNRLLMHGHSRTCREVEILLEGSKVRFDHRRFSLPRLAVEEFIERFLNKEGVLNQNGSNR